MSDLILTMSAVLAVSGVSAIGLLVLPWSAVEARDSATAWTTLGRVGVDGVAAGMGALRGVAEPRRELARVGAVRPMPALAGQRLR